MGGVVGRRFLYQEKRLSPFVKSPLKEPWIDLNELHNWGERVVIYGNCEDRYLDTVPFEVGTGGRIKKFAEDKVVDVIGFTDEYNFADVKFRLMNRVKGIHMWLHPWLNPWPAEEIVPVAGGTLSADVGAAHAKSTVAVEIVEDSDPNETKNQWTMWWQTWNGRYIWRTGAGYLDR